MRERLIQYVDLLFAGAADAEDIKQEILQNTLDRYDDLVSQGKSEEAAYRLAISGIGDINEILGASQEAPAPGASEPKSPREATQQRKMRAVAIAMYIVCAVPLFILTEFGYETLGLCMTLLLVGAATYLIVLSHKGGPKEAESAKPRDPRKEKLDRIMDIVALVVYLIVSFVTQAWLITWLIFPIAGCIEGLINAINDLKEDCTNEA